MPGITNLASDWTDRLVAVIRSAVQDIRGNGDNLNLVKTSWVALIADAPGANKPHRSFKRFMNRLDKHYDETVDALSGLADKLLRSIVRDGLGYSLESLHHDFTWTPVFREYKMWYEDQNPKVLKYLLTFLWWGKKAEFIDPTLPEKALDKWLAIEDRLKNLTPPEHLLDDLAFVLSHLPPPDMDYFSPKFGPGAVSEKDVHGVTEKLQVRYSTGLADCLDRIPSSSPAASLLVPDRRIWIHGMLVKKQRSRRDDTYQTVPKDKNNVRSMCMQPNTNMYHQQGIAHMLLHAIKESPFGDIIDITDQKRNQVAALVSSETCEYDTLDLKDASDSVHNERLIKRIFPPTWNLHLQASRSMFVKTPRGMKRTVKFAPMGSALCFPVQTLIFTAVCVVARWLSVEGTSVEEYLASPHYMMQWLAVDPKTCVYGDDIIVPREDSHTVISLLEALGFTVNTLKSFRGDSLCRESCGIYAVLGDDVTPLRFKVKGLAKAGTDDLTYVEGLISFCNRLFRAGYFSANQLLRGHLPKAFYVEVDESVADEDLLPTHLLSFNPVPRRCNHNKQLQRNDFRVKVFAKRRVPVTTEAANRYAYARFLQSTVEPKAEEIVTMVRGGKIWTLPKEYSNVSYTPATLDSRQPPLWDVEREATVSWKWVPA